MFEHVAKVRMGVHKMEPSDIELSDEVAELEPRRPRAGVVVSVRLSADEADQLHAMAQQRHLTLSQVTREAISEYLSGGGTRTLVFAPWSSANTGNASVDLSYRSFGPTVWSVGTSYVQTMPSPVASRSR